MQERVLSWLPQQANNLYYVDSYLVPKVYGQTICPAMSEPNFCNGVRCKRKKFSAISRKSWPAAWTVAMYRVRHAVHSGICLWSFSKWTPFVRLQYIIHLQQGVLDNVSESRYCMDYTHSVVPNGKSPVCWSSSTTCEYWSDEEQ